MSDELKDDLALEETIRSEFRTMFIVQEDALVWFGEISREWTHEERVARLTAALPAWPMVSGVHPKSQN